MAILSSHIEKLKSEVEFHRLRAEGLAEKNRNLKKKLVRFVDKSKARDGDGTQRRLPVEELRVVLRDLRKRLREKTEMVYNLQTSVKELIEDTSGQAQNIQTLLNDNQKLRVRIDSFRAQVAVLEHKAKP